MLTTQSGWPISASSASSSSFASPEDEVFVYGAAIRVFLQVSGEAAAGPAQPAAGAAEVSAAAAQSGRLRLCRCTVTGVRAQRKWQSDRTPDLPHFVFTYYVTNIKYVRNTHSHIKHLQELLEAREQECVQLRRQLKELKSAASLRQLLTHSKKSSELCQLIISAGLFSSSLHSWHFTHDIRFVPVLPSTFTPEPRPSPPQRNPAAAAGGLLECRKRDESKLIRNLITGQSCASRRSYNNVLWRLLHPCHLGLSLST